MSGVVTWPVNWAEQSAVVEKLERQINSLAKSRTPIVIHDITQPSRTEWESAFVEKTGQVPPIVPGTKLVWYDMKHGQMRMFTTAYDLSGGATSSGDIYEWSDANRDRSAYRFLGYVTPRGEVQNAFSRADDPTLGFLLDYNTYARRGLRALRIYFQFNFIDADINIALYLGPELPTLFSPYASFRVTRTDSFNGVVSRAGGGADNSIAIAQPSRINNYPKTGVVGYIHIDLPVGAVADDALKNTIAASSVTMVAADFGNALIGTGIDGLEITIHESAARLVNTGPVGGSLLLSTMEDTRVGLLPTNVALDPGNPNKGWVYGMFNKPTGNNLEEFTDDVSATV